VQGRLAALWELRLKPALRTLKAKMLRDKKVASFEFRVGNGA
jgi:hypothetical protein